jgi:hypothetical protein
MRVLDDASDATLVHGHDRGIAADEEGTPRLQGAIVGRIELDAGEAHADNDVVSDSDAAVDGDLVVLRDTVAQHVEDIRSVGDRRDLADSDPLDLGIEHALERIEIAGDERSIPPEEKFNL